MNSIRLFTHRYTQRWGNRAQVTPRFSASTVIKDNLGVPLDRNKGIAIYGGHIVPQTITAAARRWARAFAKNGFHIVTGGMEAARKGAQDAGGVAIGTVCRSWDVSEKSQDRYDKFTQHDTIPELFEGPGSFYECAAHQLMFPGGEGTREEATRILSQLAKGKTSHPIQRCLVIADIDPEFTHWIRSQPGFSEDYVRFVKTPEQALAIFNNQSIPKTQGSRLDQEA